MKIFVANLHPPRKYILGWMAASLATFLLISLVVSVTVGTNMSQLNTLLHSKCEYSAIAQHSAAENTYYQYNAGISFTTAADSKTRFNAEVLMQTGEGHYSDAIYRNTTNLNRNGVAVSKILQTIMDWMWAIRFSRSILLTESSRIILLRTYCLPSYRQEFQEIVSIAMASLLWDMMNGTPRTYPIVALSLPTSRLKL